MNEPVTNPTHTAWPTNAPAPHEEQTVPAGPGSALNGHSGVIASAASLGGLSWLNFISALMQTGFGAFLAVYLTHQYWSRTDIGFVLSAGTVAAMASQVPGGMLVDWSPSKRHAAAAAVLAIMVASVLIATTPSPGPVFLAQLLQGIAAAVLAPAVAALTLALSRQERLGERFGRNVRFAAIGSAVAGAIMGAIGAWLSYQAIYWFAALCAVPCLVAIYSIRAADLENAPHRATHAAVHPRHRSTPPKRVTHVFRDPTLLIFAGCVALFQLGNAALLPIAAGAVTRAFRGLPDLVLCNFVSFLPAVQLRTSDVLVGAWIVVPQLLAAWLSPRLGRYAQLHTRRKILLVGLAVLPVRALLFAADSNPVVMTAFQMLDGITAAVLGIMVPLVVADITHGGGRFNLAIGIVGLASGIGGSLSTAVGGVLSDRIGDVGTFVVLAIAGLCSCALVFLLPETHGAMHHHAASTARGQHAHAPAHRRAEHHEGARRRRTATHPDIAQRADPRG